MQAVKQVGDGVTAYVDQRRPGRRHAQAGGRLAPRAQLAERPDEVPDRHARGAGAGLAGVRHRPGQRHGRGGLPRRPRRPTASAPRRGRRRPRGRPRVAPVQPPAAPGAPPAALEENPDVSDLTVSRASRATRRARYEHSAYVLLIDKRRRAAARDPVRATRRGRTGSGPPGPARRAREVAGDCRTRQQDPREQRRPGRLAGGGPPGQRVGERARTASAAHRRPPRTAQGSAWTRPAVRRRTRPRAPG